MSGLTPVVRYLIVCEDVLRDPRNPNRLSLVNLISTIQPLGDPPFPCRYPELCIYVQLTDCRVAGQVHVEVVEADGDVPAFRTPDRALPPAADPLTVSYVLFRVQDCPFPRAGLYWVQFWYNDQRLAQQPLILR